LIADFETAKVRGEQKTTKGVGEVSGENKKTVFMLWHPGYPLHYPLPQQFCTLARLHSPCYRWQTVKELSD